MTVAYPGSPAQFAQAQAQVHAAAVAGVSAIAADLKQRVEGGDTSLPSITRIDAMAEKAIADIDSIDLPTGDETEDEQVRRLQLSPALQALAKDEAS